MADMASQTSEKATAKLSAPKDKNCPFCGQAFTSSSLGRHLDLYIKEKNPKPSDGVHDVEAIRRLRGGITRRRTRISNVGRMGSASTETPQPTARRQSSSLDKDVTPPPSTPPEATYTVGPKPATLPLTAPWETDGVTNNLPAKLSWEAATNPETAKKRPALQKAASKQAIYKTQSDTNQKLADALDTARAAELALREILGSWRAAQQQVDNNSMPFGFDPLSLDFPALTLQCLQPPPTLFSSTQHPTSTSWAIQFPGEREHDALQAFFKEEFRVWKGTCVAATAALTEELACPLAGNPSKDAREAAKDAREAAKKAEKSANSLETLVEEHLCSAYAAWDSLPTQRRQELWILELARGVGRRHKETESMKEQQHRLRQENASLKMQIDQLNRLQLPREFTLMPPTTIPMEREFINHMYEQSRLRSTKNIGVNVKDGPVDIATLVAKSIERWKSVVALTRARSPGMATQRPLDRLPDNQDVVFESQPLSTRESSQQQQSQGQQQQQQFAGQLTVNTVSSPPLEGESSGEGEEVNDEDADAEMEDDERFAVVNITPAKRAQTRPQQTALSVPRTRAMAQQHGSHSEMSFMMQNSTVTPLGRSAMAMTRPLPNLNMNMQGAQMAGGNLNMMHPARDDTLYMDNGI